MPIRRTTKDGKPAYQYGPNGAKYTYNAEQSGKPEDRQEEGDQAKPLQYKVAQADPRISNPIRSWTSKLNCC